MCDVRADGAGDPARLDGRILRGRAARTGDHHYSWGVEHRDAAELRRVVDQLPGAPLVIGHPAGMMRDGAAARVVGRVVAARVDADGYAEVDVRVDDDAAVEAIRGGLRQLSVGYTVESPRGAPHRGTTVDHLAVVEHARCGPACALRADCACGTLAPLQEPYHSGSVINARRVIAAADIIGAIRHVRH